MLLQQMGQAPLVRVACCWVPFPRLLSGAALWAQVTQQTLGPLQPGVQGWCPGTFEIHAAHKQNRLLQSSLGQSPVLGQVALRMQGGLLQMLHAQCHLHVQNKAKPEQNAVQ